MEKMFCIIDSNRGIYIPQQFAKNWGSSCISGVSLRELEILINGPENPDYFDVWDDILLSVHFMFDGVECTLYEDNDLWAVPVN